MNPVQQASNPVTQTALRIGTCNIENIKSNTTYARELLKDGKTILCLQEHWLFNFETDTLSDLFPEYDSAIKCCDDEDPILPLHKPKDTAGVAKKTLTIYLQSSRWRETCSGC